MVFCTGFLSVSEMASRCLMVSHGYLPRLIFHPEQGISKDYQPLLPCPESRQDLVRSGSLNMRLCQSEEPWKPVNGFSDDNQFVRINSTVRRPVLIDVQDVCPNSMLFSFGIAKQCTRHEEILKFLMSGSSEVERGGLNLAILSDLIGLQAVAANMPQLPCAPDYRSCFYDPESEPSLIYPSIKYHSQKPLLDFVGDLAHRSEIMVHLDGRVSFTGAGTEMKDILSIIAEFYLSKNSTKWRRQSVLVPQFSRLDCIEARANITGSSLTLETVTVAPLKSPEKIKLKPSPKKKSSRKAGRERDLYRKNYFHACESLLSIMVDKKQRRKTAMLAMKKSGPELPQFLTQFSASIAGTGLALLLSVVCKVASSRVPFCASKLLNTGFGLGLVWLSSAVNRLRDTIICISKNSGKLELKEEEMMKNLDRSVKEIYFRAAMLMAVVVLRLA